MKRIQLLVGTMLALAGVSYGLDGTWNADVSTNWGAGPWVGGVPNGVGEVAAFTNDITAARTVTNETTRTVGTILLGDNTGNNGGFTILGSPLTLDVTTGMALVSKRYSTLADTIAADLVLNDDLTISNGVNGGAAAALIISGGMSGAYNVQKTGSGWLILDGNNTFGSLLISAGTVQVGRASTSGTLGYGPVTNNSMLQFFRSDDFVVTNNVIGSGIFRQLNGSGSVTLLGSNTMGSLLLGAGRLESALILGAGSTNLVTGDVQLGVLGGTGLGQYGRLVVSSGATLRAVNMYLGNASGSWGTERSTFYSAIGAAAKGYANVTNDLEASPSVHVLVFAGTNEADVVYTMDGKVIGPENSSGGHFETNNYLARWNGIGFEAVGASYLIEFFVLRTNADTATRQKIEGYAVWQVGSQAKLPEDHPYKAAAP